MKRVNAIALAGILALAAVSPVAAATSSGTTPESLSIAATISMTVPTSVTYTQGKALNSSDITLTNLDTDNPNGLTVKLDVNAAGSGLINPASRSLANGPAVAGWTGPGTIATPFPNGGSSEQVDVAYYGSNNPSVHSFTFVSKVNASSWSPGTYTGSLHFVASTN
jgi:hypothetical protein